jgi:hypothetical protein
LYELPALQQTCEGDRQDGPVSVLRGEFGKQETRQSVEASRCSPSHPPRHARHLGEDAMMAIRQLIQWFQCRWGWCGGHPVSGWHDGILWMGWQCDRCGAVRHYGPTSTRWD